MTEETKPDMKIDLNFSITLQIAHMNLASPVKINVGNNNARVSVNQSPVPQNRPQNEQQPPQQPRHTGPRTPPTTPPPSPRSLASLDLYKLAKKFKELHSANHITSFNFLDFCQHELEWLEETSGEILSCQMKGTSEWQAMIKGRITEKYIHSAQRSGNRENDFLVSRIVGYAARVTRSETYLGSLDLKAKVLQNIREVWSQPEHNLRECGLFVRPDLPIFAATIDAISDHFCYKIMPCDSTDMFKRLNAAKLTESELNELNFAMHLTKRRKTYIFVVHPNYPKTKLVNTISMEYDGGVAHDIVLDAQNFWHQNVFPIIIKA